MQQFSNGATSLLAVGISDTDLVVQVTASGGDLFPDAVGADVYFMVTVEDAAGNYEIMKVTDRTGDQLTVVRAQEDTVTPLVFTSGARVELRTTKGTMEVFLQRDGDVIDGGTY